MTPKIDDKTLIDGLRKLVKLCVSEGDFATSLQLDDTAQRLTELTQPAKPIGSADSISHEEAEKIAFRFIHSHFNTEGEKPTASIPANPRRDDDLRLLEYIRQQDALQSNIPDGVVIPESIFNKLQGPDDTGNYVFEGDWGNWNWLFHEMIDAATKEE